MPVSRNAMFVSATSRDLQSCREVVKDALFSAGIWPESQEHFPPDHRGLVDSLRATIGRCDGMICVVGEAYGEAPVASAGPPRSYTQIEYDIARELGKRIYVLMTSEGFASASRPPEPLDRVELQRRHRRALLSEQTVTVFSSLEELRLRVTQLLLVPGFLDSPAIAVMQFNNMSGDPDQDYFAAGIAEDLITRLSRWRTFPVIARNSSFTFKATRADVTTIGRELAVRYVVEGSVRRSGNRVRISAKLIDASTSLLLWGESYDRELEDVLALQDQIAEAIVGALQEVAGRAERQRVISANPRDLNAWDRVQRGLWHIFKYTKHDTEAARRLATQAIELDPSFSGAYALLAASHFTDLLYRWSESPVHSLAEAQRAAQTSVQLDPDAPVAQTVLGFACVFTGQIEPATAALSRAVEVNPSFALAYYGLGVAHLVSGRPEDSIPMISKAIRLSPRDPMLHQILLHLGQAHFVAKQYKEASGWVERSLALRQDPQGYRILAASQGFLGEADKGSAAIEALFELDPNFDPTAPGLAELPILVETYLEGWRRTGWQGGRR